MNKYWSSLLHPFPSGWLNQIDTATSGLLVLWRDWGQRREGYPPASCSKMVAGQGGKPWKVRAPKTEAMTALSVSFTSCFCLTHPDRCSSNYHLNTTSDGELTTTTRFVHRSMVQNVRFFP